MSDTEFNSDAFADTILAGSCRDAVASIMGQNPIGIDRSKMLLIEFNKLDTKAQEAILNWSLLPSERLPIDNHRWIVEKIARHEMAHVVAAKAMGFNTGEATLVLYSPDGSHQGTSLIYLDESTPSLEDVAKYLDRRIIVLLAGYLAEPEDARDRKNFARQIIQNNIAESDLQKALELLRIKLNIEGSLQPEALEGALHAQIQRASSIVEANFSVIASLAQKFAARIDYFGQRIGWEGREIDDQPEIQQIVVMQ